MARARALQVPMSDELRGRIKAIADAEKISEAQVARDILEHGIAWRERLCETRTLS